MADFRYRAVNADGDPLSGIVTAHSLYDATDEIRTKELDLLSIKRVEDAQRSYEPPTEMPPAAPREVPPGVTGMACGSVLMVVGGIFMAVVMIFVLVGLGLI